MPRQTVPANVAAINREITAFLNTKADSGKAVGNSKYGVYAFYDYDGEPIYVGQTAEKLRTRIRRHLTNQRTDAVAMNVLDPAEVAEIEVWPFFELDAATIASALDTLNAAEYTVFQTVVKGSSLGAVLNEKDIPAAELINLPRSFRKRIIPDDIYENLKHPDTRIARRAATIANLARVISEREVSKGLRRTLVTQAKRLEKLAEKRLDEFGGSYTDEDIGEETGEAAA